MSTLSPKASPTRGFYIQQLVESTLEELQRRTSGYPSQFELHEAVARACRTFGTECVGRVVKDPEVVRNVVDRTTAGEP